MGRLEPCVLFSQTFVHPQLDEYVDEVLFAEPVVITACEFLEQNASSISQVVPLVGATSPPSFALEVFVQCEGETRFRRLCQPFLYSHSSSNVLEVEAVVTSHLVVRGSYRSLSLIIYGNTAEDLGQFNIEFDDNSLTNLVSSSEGGLEDLPLALRSTYRTVEESLSSLNVLSLPVAASDISVEVKLFLQLTLKMLGMPSIENSVYEVLGALVTAVCSYVRHDLCCVRTDRKEHSLGGSEELEQMNCAIEKARKKLFEVNQHTSEDSSFDLLAEFTSESHADLPSSKQLVEMIIQHMSFLNNSTNVKRLRLSQCKNITLELGLALLLCSSRESCFYFVNGGGMEQVVDVFSCDIHDSSPAMLLLLGVMEQVTRHPIGCEGILGWWPREDENIPSGISKGYSQLLKLLLKKPHHDIACLATCVLHRLRFYEVVSRYECAVLSLLGSLCSVGRFTTLALDMLTTAKSQLKRLLTLINSRGPVEDPSPVAFASRALILGQTEGILSYKATSGLIGSSDCCFGKRDVDLYFLGLLKERGFLPLSAALLSSPTLRSMAGHTMDTFIDIASTIGSILLSLLMSRSGLIFLSHYPELSTTLIDALRGGDLSKEDCVPLRYASVLSSKGFVCSPREVGIIVEMHLRVVNAIDRLVASTPHSEEFLWVLWELCGLSRSDCGRQALLVLGYFPEAVSILIEALHLVKESEPPSKNNGASPINLAIYHSAAEIFEIIVNDSTASSLSSWIGHAMDLHKALHSSSPGSNRKDAPTRLLEWIDTGVVYHKNGAIGLLRYSAILASGGDAHLTSTNILVSDLTAAENVIGDASGSGDINVMDNLGKFVSEKAFDGVVLPDSAIAQLTTAIRILAFISENSTVAAALYDEGAITVIYAILVNCSFMLERSSNSYDYLVDEGADCNSTSDLLSERNREQSIVDLLVPSLFLLTTLFQKLQEAKEQHRNTKLMNALLRLHREVSPKLAACAADLSSSYPDSALGFGAVCHLVVSALTFWPVYGWSPGLFHSLLSSVQVTSVMALGPKETCSLLCLMIDLFPEEGIWLWKNGMPLLSALRTLAVGTILGPQKERQVNWYLEPMHHEKLLSQLTLHLDRIAQIIQHYAISALVVIRDMLRVFIVRIACQRVENASKLLRPILSSVQNYVLDLSSPSDIDVYKVYRYLDFIASMLEHPCTKMLLLEEGLPQILCKVLEKCFGVTDADGKRIPDGKSSASYGLTLTSWCLPVFKCLFFLFGPETSQFYPARHDLSSVCLSNKDISLILPYLLRSCQVLPVGKELLSCLACFKELGSLNDGRKALVTLCHQVNGNVQELGSERGHETNGNYNCDDPEWKRHPFLNCWKKLMKSIYSEDDLSAVAVEAVNELCTCLLFFCMDGKSLNLKAVAAIKYLFGLHDNEDGTNGPPENVTLMEEMMELLNSKTQNDDCTEISENRDILCQASESASSLLLLLKSTSSVTSDQIMSIKDVSLKQNQISDTSSVKLDDFLYLGELGEKFVWECPKTLPDKSNPGKRKLSSLDGSGKRVKGENSTADITSQSAFSRALGPSTASCGPTRRDTFRQRKPNTSRPPSMHVDDYVARERNVDGSTNSNVIATQRLGSSSGRPPSIHVDEFMARQRERQNPTATVVAEPATQQKNPAPVSDPDKEKVDKSKQLKTDLDDELQGIDIVFDGEESDTDDKLPFPQPDDNLQQPEPVIVEQSSPHSIVEETESDVNESSQFNRMGTPLASNGDENTQSEFSSRMSVSRPEMPLTREPSVSSDKKFFEHSDDLKSTVPVRTSSGYDSVGPSNASGFPTSFYNKAQLHLDPRMTPQNIYPKNSPQHASGSRGHYDQKVPLNQPPLPPMPPPSTVPPLMSQTLDPAASQSSPYVNSLTDMHSQVPAGFQVQSDHMSTYGNSPASSVPMSDSKYPRAAISSPGGSGGPHPPLPPTPPPFSSSPYNQPPVKASSSQSSAYNIGTSEFPQSFGSIPTGGLSSYMPTLAPPMIFNRPASIPGPMYGNTPAQHQGENPAMLQNMAIPQPLQPPLQRPLQPPQHPWPPVQQPPHQLEQGVSPLQNPVQRPPLQVLQQLQISPMHGHYQSQQPEASISRHQQVEHVQPQHQHQPELGMSLHEYFKDPAAIASLLNNKEELCRLLEQNPKLMQMLQEKLGQH